MKQKKPNYSISNKILDQELINKFLKKFNSFSQKNNFFFVIGGDGYFLRVLKKHINLWDKITFFPLFSGSLGLFYSFSVNDFLNCKNFLLEKIDTKKVYPLLIKGLPNLELQNNLFFAINEFKIISLTTSITIDIFLNDKKLFTHVGSGILFSTSFGSTGIAKSNNNTSIIYHKKNYFQISEIFPCNNKINKSYDFSILFEESDIIFFKITKNIKNAKFFHDNAEVNVEFLENQKYQVYFDKTKYFNFVVEKNIDLDYTFFQKIFG
ncbi:hypothetical protein JTY60_02220 [symbiont of Argiope bruennichi]|uniref:hypothetical protein n=1 Tax=symbiont of Argiope bruennichi TaxID=2810479 RepID=UPI003DA4B76C